jgi:hypothetical protein
MKYFLLCLLASVLFLGCKKDRDSRVDIFLLKSFTVVNDPSTSPAAVRITNAELESSPLVSDQDIASYKLATTTFTLKKDIKPIIKDFGADKAFAVTVNRQPVYFGLFHPSYLSSMSIGIATIDPFLYNNNELPIQFVNLTGVAVLHPLDKRNDDMIINAFKASNRLR